MQPYMTFENCNLKSGFVVAYMFAYSIFGKYFQKGSIFENILKKIVLLKIRFEKVVFLKIRLKKQYTR